MPGGTPGCCRPSALQAWTAGTCASRVGRPEPLLYTQSKASQLCAGSCETRHDKPDGCSGGEAGRGLAIQDAVHDLRMRIVSNVQLLAQAAQHLLPALQHIRHHGRHAKSAHISSPLCAAQAPGSGAVSQAGRPPEPLAAQFLLLCGLTQWKVCCVKARSTLVYASSRSSPNRARPSGVGCTAAAIAMPGHPPGSPCCCTAVSLGAELQRKLRRQPSGPRCCCHAGSCHLQGYRQSAATI